MSDPELRARRDEAERWLPFVNADIAAIEMALKLDPPLSSVAAYHCQQAAEKLLKALLVLAGRPIRKIHDLDTLMTAAQSDWPHVAETLGPTVSITSWGFAYRYPNAGPAFEPPPSSMIEVSLDDIRRLRAFVVAKLAAT